MEMQQVIYFRALCEELNFTRAARRCNVSQPSLTRSIRCWRKNLAGLSSPRAQSHPSFRTGRDRKAPPRPDPGRSRGGEPESARSQAADGGAAEARRDVHGRAERSRPAADRGPRPASGSASRGRRTPQRKNSIAGFGQGNWRRRSLRPRPGARAASALPAAFSRTVRHCHQARSQVREHESGAGLRSQRGRLSAAEPIARSRKSWDKASTNTTAVRGPSIGAIATTGFWRWPRPAPVTPSCRSATVIDQELVAKPLVDPEIWREVSLVTVRGRPHSPAVGALVREAMRSPWANERALAAVRFEQRPRAARR